MDLNTQHCLAIAAAFIAIIAACATLITSANNKAESLANRIRGAAKEHRERGDNARCQQLRAQIDLFKIRFRRVQGAQRLLLLTIGIFVASLTIFIAIGLYLLAGGTADPLTSSVLIGTCITIGSFCMLGAIHLQYSEVGETYKTLCIETSDCDARNEIDLASTVDHQASCLPQSKSELASSLVVVTFTEST